MGEREKLARYLRSGDDPLYVWEQISDEAREYWYKEADYIMNHMGWEYNE